MFVNPEVPLESLPVAEQVDWQALHPRFVRRLQAKKLIHVVVAFALAAAAHYFALRAAQLAWLEAWMPLAVWAVLGLWACWSLSWPAVEVPHRGYAVRDKDILYKSGVLWRSMTAVPCNRVQHAVTSSAPLDRRFGLATLTVFTAGGAGGDLQIAGLGEERAESLRVFIVGKLGLRPRPDDEARQDGPVGG